MIDMCVYVYVFVCVRAVPFVAQVGLFCVLSLPLVLPTLSPTHTHTLHSRFASVHHPQRNSSLLDEMDISTLSAAEMDAMRELEALSRNLSVFFKGTLDLQVQSATGGGLGGDKINKFDFDWTITSFREAEI